MTPPFEPAPLPDLPDDTRRTRQDRLIAFLLFFGVFAVYGATLCRTIYTGDDGDFITAMATWGTPHPTGYPLFCLLGRLFLEILPLGTPALRVNIMTALFGAASVGMTYRFLALLVPHRRFWAVFAALVFAFAPTLWQQSLSCEVYSLTCLFLATLLYLITRWLARPEDTRLLRLLAVTFGLSLTNHLTMALFLPGFLVLVFATRRTLWREGRVLASLIGLFLLPLALYAYLPLAARANPPVAWGNPTTPETFWAHITGAQFRDLMFSSRTLMFKQMRDYGSYLLNEYGVWFLWLVPIGAWALWRQRRGLCLLLLYIWLANVLYAVNYAIFDIYVYYLPSYLIAAALLAVGASRMMDAVWDRLRLSTDVRAHYTPLVAVVALVIPVVQMSLHYAAADKSGNYIEEDFTANILRSAPPHALVVTGSNLSLTLWYRRFVLDERPDVTPIDRGIARGMFLYGSWYFRHLWRMYPDIAHTNPSHRVSLEEVASGDYLLRTMQRAVRRGVPVLIVADARFDHKKVADRYPSFNDQINRVFDRTPWGVTERLYLKGQTPPPERIVAENERLWRTFRTRGLYTGWAHADPLQEHIPLRYADAQVALGALAEKAGRYDIAEAAYRQSLRLYRIPAADQGLARCAQRIIPKRQASR